MDVIGFGRIPKSEFGDPKYQFPSPKQIRNPESEIPNKPEIRNPIYLGLYFASRRIVWGSCMANSSSSFIPGCCFI